MAAPTPTARVAPTGPKFTDGYKTLITLAADSNIEFWEKEVTPPGVEGGDPIMTGDMFNTAWETKVLQALKTTTPVTLVANLKGVTLTSCVAICNVATTITVRFPDTSTLCFYGGLRSAKPNAFVKGQQPTITIVIEPTNTDPSDGSEAGPVFTAAA